MISSLVFESTSNLLPRFRGQHSARFGFRVHLRYGVPCSSSILGTKSSECCTPFPAFPLGYKNRIKCLPGVFEGGESESAIRLAKFLCCDGDFGPGYCSFAGIIGSYPAIVLASSLVCTVTVASPNSTTCTRSPRSKRESSCAIIF